MATAIMAGQDDNVQARRMSAHRSPFLLDCVLLDCPPSLGVLTTDTLVAAAIVIVPLQCEYLALCTLKQLQKIITNVSRKANPHLRTRIPCTMDDGRTIHDREIFEEIARGGGDQVFQTFIKHTIKIAEAVVEGEPIVRYATDSEAAHAYRELAMEIS
jgi:chromosome partitioning protein